MAWDEKRGVVSRSFDRWIWVEREIRAFHRLGLLWAEHAYSDLWEKAEAHLNEIFDPDIHAGDEHLGYFSRSVDGMWPDRFEWMIHAATIRDAVTAFEVYLEKALREVLRKPRVQEIHSEQWLRFEFQVRRGQESPDWVTLKEFHALIGADIETDRVREIRALRHLLTHQRGELRSESSVQRFAGGAGAADDSERESWERPYVGGDVNLNRELVTEILDDLAGTIRSADARAWAMSFGPEMLSLAQLEELVRRKYIMSVPAEPPKRHRTS